MIQASVYTICLNEEKHISRLLENVKEFAEVILVDSGSTDNTLLIAKKYANVKIIHHNWEGFAKQKAFALSQCTKEWVLNLDADEEISPVLKQEIIQTISTNNCDALSSKLCDIFLGKKPHKLTKHHDKIRFFKKNCGSYNHQQIVHESIKINGKIKKGKGLIYHHGLQSIHITVQKNNEYSTLAAKNKFSNNKNYYLLRIFFIFPLQFLRAYFFRRYCLNGISGFIYSINIAYYAFQKEAKLYEMWLNKK